MSPIRTALTGKIRHHSPPGTILEPIFSKPRGAHTANMGPWMHRWAFALQQSPPCRENKPGNLPERVCVFSVLSWYAVACWLWTSSTRVTKSYLLALGTTQISSFFTKHWTKFLTHQTGNYPVTCFVSKPSGITLVELSIINTSYQELPFGSGDYPDKLLFHQALN